MTRSNYIIRMADGSVREFQSDSGYTVAEGVFVFRDTTNLVGRTFTIHSVAYVEERPA